MAGITLEDVAKVYPDGTEAVSDLDLEIGDGEFMVLVGPSGCGKTTALRMVAGLESISRGTVRIGDRIVNKLAPKDRDVAMVFQNYALYPHMTVAENMGFGLRMQGVSKDQIRARVDRAARALGLVEHLDRKPRQLSGGQRQRVAMGRAIVREPRAFLMDEPLSNLDAKLRVQMRAEISRIQRDVGVTTIYVTHDQTEAMTMGDRVAVLKKGLLQQVASPQELYDRPSSLFVAGFIGSPAMNMVEAHLERRGEGMHVRFADVDLELDRTVVTERPALDSYVGRTIVLGFRPESIEDATLRRDAPQGQRFKTTVELREALGSEVLVHFRVAVPPVLTDDTRELAVDMGDDAGIEADAAAQVSDLVARLDPRTHAAEGEGIELYVDTTRFHFFDPQSGAAISGA
jgi:multiple sugar transport system ATP-binding protein